MKTNLRMKTENHCWGRPAGWLAALLVLGGVTGCSFTQPQADPTRFYLLAATGTPAGATVAAKAPVVHLRPIELASYIRAKPMIVRRGNNEIEFREYARWGEPLELGIGRVLREELVARGAAGAVFAAGLRAVEVEYDYALVVRVLASEGGANGAVYFRAIWELSTVGATPKTVARGEVNPTDLRWDAKGEASLAAELSKAVALLAENISAGIARVAK